MTAPPANKLMASPMLVRKATHAPPATIPLCILPMRPRSTANGSLRLKSIQAPNQSVQAAPHDCQSEQQREAGSRAQIAIEVISRNHTGADAASKLGPGGDVARRAGEAWVHLLFPVAHAIDARTACAAETVASMSA